MSSRNDLTTLFCKDPMRQYYNLESLTDVILTTDTDWAPDFVIATILEAVKIFGHKLTIFATNRSDLLQNLNDDSFEIGLHPDFTMRHHNTPFKSVMDNLLELYPNAKGMRSHCDFFGDNIANLAHDIGLKYDVSVFEWNCPALQGHVDYNGLVRLPYFWEDGIHLNMEIPLDWSQIRLNTPGLKVLNVHPILIYMNCKSDEDRRTFVRQHKDLTQIRSADIDPVVRSERGIRDVWMELLEMLAENKVRTHLLADVAKLGSD